LRAGSVVALLLGLLGCGGGIPRPDPAQLDRARARWPTMSTGELEEGYRLYVARCSGCHALHRPEEQDAAGWERILPRMAPRARLSADETERIRRYLASAAR
jgi:mono/diheme cytochrome c family protein